MHVLYLHQHFAVPDMPGGTRPYEMAVRLVRDGHQVTLITSGTWLDPTWSDAPGWHSRQVDGIRLEIIRIPYANALGFAQRIRQFLTFAVSAAWHVRRFKADVVFASSTPLTIAIPAIAAQAWHRIPLVFEVRDLWPDMPIAVGAIRSPLTKAASRALEWIAYHGASHIVVLSPGMRLGVMRRGIPASRITEIPNSCDVDVFQVAPEAGTWVRRRLGIESDVPLVVYPGAFGRLNGVGYLVRVAANMRMFAPDVRFLLVGSGAEFDAVTEEARRLGILGTNLWIWPILAKRDMPGVLAAATVVASVFVPIEAMWVNSANKFFDALAAGRPVTINYGGWQADLLCEHGAGIVLSPDDPAAAARDLAGFLCDASRVASAGAAALNLATTVFNRDLMYARLARVLTAATAGRPRTEEHGRADAT